MYRNYRFRQPSGGGGGGAIILLLLLVMLPMMAAVAYLGYQKFKGEDENGTPALEYKVVDGVPQLTKIEPSDCSGTEYVKKKSCHNRQTGELLDGTTGKCGEGVEEWVLDPDAPGYQPIVGTGTCESDFRPCEVTCDEPCKGDSWIEGPCMRDGVILDGSETDKCGRGMRTYTLDENAPDYEEALGNGTCVKNYASACDVECPNNAVAPPACVYSSTWQRSANGCVVSKEDRAALVGYDQDGWQEYFKLALEAENCTGEKRLSEWETCRGPPGPVNCEGTWGPDGGWGTCTGSCGTQPSQSRTYSVTKEAAHGGSQCPYSDGETQTRNCGTIVPCPVDCQGYYTDPACPTACGQAESTVTKNWITTTQQVGTGAACPPSTSTKSCPATAVCPVDCRGYYTDPACPTACGTAASTLTKNWVTTTAKAGTGAACPPSTSTKSCPATATCPVDCQGYYTDPACPTACGTAASTLTKNWVTTTAKVGTGAACPPSTSTKSCPATAACPVDCQGYYSDPLCPTACGTAASTLTKNWVTTTAKVGTGAACPPSTSTKSCPATAACPSDCQGTWELGSTYGKSVGSGRGATNCQYRDDTYRVTRPAVGTGAACPYTDGARRTDKITSIGRGCQSGWAEPKYNHTW